MTAKIVTLMQPIGMLRRDYSEETRTALHIPASSQAESVEILIISSNLPSASSRSVYEALKQPQLCYLMFAIWHMPILVDVEAAVVSPLPPQICYHKSANVWLLADGALPIVLTTDVLLH